MTQSTRTTTLARPLVPLPQQLVSVMRPELPSLCSEIAAAIFDAVPGYRTARDGPCGNLIRELTQRNVVTFASRIVNPDAPSPERDELCRTAGRLEALTGHSMDRLQSAYRIGAHTALRRMIAMARRHSLPTAVVSSFADALFSYVEELTALSREGHREAMPRSRRTTQERRARLLRQLISGTPAVGLSLAESAERAAWPLPAEATAVALPLDADIRATDLDSDILSDLCDARPFLLIPGQFCDDRREMLERALGPAHAAVGLTMPVSKARHSLRWARQILAMRESSLIPDAGLALAEDHLLALWLASDPELVQRIGEQQLTPLDGLTPARRRRHLETLLAWLTERGNVELMSKTLEIHPQTVRYRMRLLDKVLGPLLEDPVWRITSEVVLRGQLMRETSGRRASGSTALDEISRA